MTNNFITILVTCSSKKEATAIVNLLLKNRLIACANIITGLESKFWWNGRVNNAKEVLTLLKSRRKNWPDQFL